MNSDLSSRAVLPEIIFRRWLWPVLLLEVTPGWRPELALGLFHPGPAGLHGGDDPRAGFRTQFALLLCPGLGWRWRRCTLGRLDLGPTQFLRRGDPRATGG